MIFHFFQLAVMVSKYADFERTLIKYYLKILIFTWDSNEPRTVNIKEKCFLDVMVNVQIIIYYPYKNAK